MRNHQQQQSYGYTNSTYSGNSGYSRGGAGSGTNGNYYRGEKRGGANTTTTSNHGAYNNTTNSQGGSTYYQGDRNDKEYKPQSDSYNEGSNYQGRSTYNISQKQQSSKRGGAPSHANSKRYPPSGSITTQQEDPYYDEGTTSGKYFKDEYYQEEYYYYGQEDYTRQAASSSKTQKKPYEEYYQESYQKPSKEYQQQNNTSRVPDQRSQDGYQDYYNEEEEAAYQQQHDSYYKGSASGSNKDQYSRKSKNYQETSYHQPPSSDSYNKQQRTNQAAPAEQYGKKNDYDQRQKRGGAATKSSYDYRGSSTQGYGPYRTTASKRGGGGDSHQQYGDHHQSYGNEKEPNEHDYYYGQEVAQEDIQNKKVEEIDKKAQNKYEHEDSMGYQYRPKKYANQEESKYEKMGKHIIIQTGQGASKKDEIPITRSQSDQDDDNLEQYSEYDEQTPMPAQPHRKITIKQEPTHCYANIEEGNQRQREDSNASWATIEEQTVENQASCTSSTPLNSCQKDQKSLQKPSPQQQIQESQKPQPSARKQSEQIQGQLPPNTLQGQTSVKSESPNLRHQNSGRHSNYLVEDDLEHHILQNIPDPEYKELDTKNSPNNNYQHQAQLLANQFNQQMSLDSALKDTGMHNNWNGGVQQVNAMNSIRHVSLVRQTSDEMNPQQYMQQHRQVIFNQNIAMQHHQNQLGGPSMHPQQHHILQSPSPPILQNRQQYPQYSPQTNNFHLGNSPYGGGSAYSDPMLSMSLNRQSPAQGNPGIGNNYANNSSFRPIEQVDQSQQAMQYMNFNQQPGLSGSSESGMMQRHRIDQMPAFTSANILQQHLSANLNSGSGDISPIQYHQPQLQHSHSLQEEGNPFYPQKRQQTGGINQGDSSSYSQNANFNNQYQTMPSSAQLNYNAQEFVPSFKKKITNQMSSLQQNNQMREGGNMVSPPLIGHDQYFQNHNFDLNYQSQQQMISAEQQQYIQYMQHQKQLQQLNAYGTPSNISQVHTPITGLREQSSGNTVLYDNSPSYQTQAQMIQYQTQQQMMMTSQNNFQHPYYAANGFNQGPTLDSNHYGNNEDDQDNFENNGDQYDPDNKNQPDVSSFNFMLNSPDIMQHPQFQFPNNGFNH